MVTGRMLSRAARCSGRDHPSIPGEKATDSVDLDFRTIQPEPSRTRPQAWALDERGGQSSKTDVRRHPSRVALAATSAQQQQAELGSRFVRTTAEPNGQMIASLVVIAGAGIALLIRSHLVVLTMIRLQTNLDLIGRSSLAPTTSK
jgi:hypothetical protein